MEKTLTQTQLNKYLELLNSNKTEELKKQLLHDLLQTQDTKKAKFFNLVQKYLKNAGKERPALGYVQNVNGVQSIINGFTGILFKKYVAELEPLNITAEYQSIDFGRILSNDVTYSAITGNDLIILNNLAKYISYAKAELNEKEIFVFFNDTIINTALFKELLDITGNDLKYAKQNIGNLSPTQFNNGNLTSIILPIRAREEERNKIIELTEKFCKELSEV